MSVRPVKCMLLAPVLGLLLLGHSFGAKDDYDVWRVPPGQPEQMWSKVDYDPKLSDPFFKSNEWSYQGGGLERPDPGMLPEGEKPRKLRHTARCFSTSLGIEHLVRFCEARLLDVNMIDLLIHDDDPAFIDALRVQIRNGMFTCQYSTAYK